MERGREVGRERPAYAEGHYSFLLLLIAFIQHLSIMTVDRYTHSLPLTHTLTYAHTHSHAHALSLSLSLTRPDSFCLPLMKTQTQIC